MGSLSWIAVLLATASFIGFVTVPGGFLDRGQSQVALRNTAVSGAKTRPLLPRLPDCLPARLSAAHAWQRNGPDCHRSCNSACGVG